MEMQWDVVFAESAQAALHLLEQAPVDVLVSDIRMPGMNGVQLLTTVAEHYPHIIRFILSGQADQRTILQSAMSAHQYLAKPCDPEHLQATIARACALCDKLTDTTLQRAVCGLRTLPSSPDLYLQLRQAIEDVNCPLERIGSIMARDIAMAANLLKLVNSAFFGVYGAVSSPFKAVALLGRDLIKTLVVSSDVFAPCDPACLRQFDLAAVYQRSLETALLARKIAQDVCPQPRVADEAYTAGLLQGVGKLALASNLETSYREVCNLIHQQGLTDWEAESSVLGMTHAEIGAYLIELWGLPQPIIEGLAFSNCPSSSSERSFGPLSAVYIARALIDEIEHTGTETIIPIDDAYLADLNLSDRFVAWRTSYRAVRGNLQMAGSNL
jgi:HD-like signal output (HDOD) protein